MFINQKLRDFFEGRDAFSLVLSNCAVVPIQTKLLVYQYQQGLDHSCHLFSFHSSPAALVAIAKGIQNGHRISWEPVINVFYNFFNESLFCLEECCIRSCSNFYGQIPVLKVNSAIIFKFLLSIKLRNFASHALGALCMSFKVDLVALTRGRIMDKSRLWA